MALFKASVFVLLLILNFSSFCHATPTSQAYTQRDVELKPPAREGKEHPNRYLRRPYNTTWSERLKGDLLRSYDRYLRPEEEQGVTHVNLSMVFKNIDLDYSTAKLSINSWISMKWFDPGLQWDSKKYGNIRQIYLAPKEVWQPDLSTFNSAGGNDVSPFGETYHIASNDGRISWLPPCQFQVYCNLDLTYWPLDTQVCELVLGSWVYDGNSIDFHFEDDKVEVNQDNSLWEITRVTQSKSVEYFTCCPEPYVILTYTISFRLRSPAYCSLIFVPTLVIVILTLASFYLPPSSSEKFLLCGTNIIMTSALLIFFSHKLPLMVSTTPIIVMFYTNTLCMLSVSMICSIVIQSVQTENKVPRYIEILLNSKLVSYFNIDKVGAPQITNIAMLRNRVALDNVDGMGPQDVFATSRIIPDRSQEWKKLAAVVDRALFYLYLAVLAMMGVIILIRHL